MQTIIEEYGDVIVICVGVFILMRMVVMDVNIYSTMLTRLLDVIMFR